MIDYTYTQKESIIHRLNFWTKLLCLSLILPLAAFLASIKWLLLLASVFIVIFTLSKINFRKFWRMVKIYIITITVGLLLLSLFFSPGNIQEKIISAIILASRFSLLISFGILFSTVTNPIEIPAGFMQVKIPHKFGVTLMVAYRMMPLLSKKIAAIIDAQKTRGASFRFSFIKPKKFLYQLFSLIIPSLHATLEMSVRLSDALISRGYNPEARITIPPAKSSIYDLTLLGISVGIVTMIILDPI